jgi:DNA uptake protein ComE-like DNA-binding protein
MKDRIKDYFTFTRKEQRGIIVLLGIMLLSIAAAIFLPGISPEKQFDISPFQLEVEQFLASVEKADSTEKARPTKFQDNQKNETGPVLAPFLASPFYFDPNKLKEEEWLSMGMDAKIARNILRYRDKGGKFRDPEGFRKIYGMNDDIFSILEPFIRFETTETKSKIKTSEFNRPQNKAYDDNAIKKYEPEKIHIELNSADSASLLDLTGIGPSFAGRIIKYRNRLGGFCSKEQLFEVTGMDSLRYNQFSSQVSIDTGLIKKINLNTVVFKELMRHPYFEYYLVKAIFKRKDELKAFDSVGQLRYLPVMYEELYEKISPYLEVKPGNTSP